MPRSLSCSLIFAQNTLRREHFPFGYSDFVIIKNNTISKVLYKTILIDGELLRSEVPNARLILLLRDMKIIPKP